MSSRQSINRADFARALAVLQPKLIADRLFESRSFRSEFGIDSDRAISFGGGPPAPKTGLYQTTRDMFNRQAAQTLTAVTGEQIRISPAAETVAISVLAGGEPTTTAHSLNLMLLSPSIRARQKALRTTAEELGPTGPDPANWRGKLQQGPLDDEDMDRFWREIDASVNPNMARVARDLMTATLDRTHLVPRSRDYWVALCGAPVDGMDQETWLKDVFQPHRRRLVKRGLVPGLDLCLPMGIRHDLTPRALTKHLSHNAMWAALQQLLPIDDPFSLLGLADIAVSRSRGDRRFAGLATDVVRRLSARTLPRQDGIDVYAFLPAFVRFIEAELRVIPGVGHHPAYWRRLCSWTQAALLVRAFHTVTFDTGKLSHSITSDRTPEGVMAELLELRQDPLSHPSATSRTCIRAEILGRLLILQQCKKTQGRTLPGDDAFAQAIAEQAEVGPLLVHMPGPLELRRSPPWNFETLPELVQTGLRDRANELTSNLDDPNWIRFIHLARMIQYDNLILARITELAGKAAVPSSTIDERHAAIARIAEIGYIAVAQRHVPLSDALLGRCLETAGASTDAAEASALFKIGVIATAAAEDALDRLARYLGHLARLVPQGEVCQVLSAEMGVLKSLTPLENWHRLAQPEALARLGSR